MILELCDVRTIIATDLLAAKAVTFGEYGTFDATVTLHHAQAAFYGILMKKRSGVFLKTLAISLKKDTCQHNHIKLGQMIAEFLVNELN